MKGSDFEIETWAIVSSSKTGSIPHLAEVINKYICKVFSGQMSSLCLNKTKYSFLSYQTSQGISFGSLA